VVLDVTAKNLDEENSEKQLLFSDQKVWWEIGIDLEGRMRYGAWQIKEIVDLTLQPMETRKERFLMNFDTDIETVEIEVKLSYFINGKKGDVIHSEKKTIEYDYD
jgi:hypothetical protein